MGFTLDFRKSRYLAESASKPIVDVIAAKNCPNQISNRVRMIAQNISDNNSYRKRTYGNRYRIAMNRIRFQQVRNFPLLRRLSTRRRSAARALSLQTLFRDAIESRRAFATLNVDLLRIAMTHGQFVDSAIERFEKAMKMR